MEQQPLAANQFGSRAAEYLASAVHSSGADLVKLTDAVCASTAVRVLDMGCGAGHASFAMARGGATDVVAYDLSPAMLEVVAAEANVRGHAQIHTAQGPAESLAFPDASFDMVVTRYSAHHWLDMRQGIHEAARVLKPGGTLIVIDVISPEIPLFDTVLQTVEILRDLSHVRDYRESEWRSTLAGAGLSDTASHRWKLTMEFDGWVARIGTSAARITAVKTVLDELPGEAREYFSVSQNRSFSIDAGWFEARKGS
jgi:ubiquinone/menaquinone biosynthesis C-methylase UbiE